MSELKIFESNDVILSSGMYTPLVKSPFASYGLYVLEKFVSLKIFVVFET